jgi:Fusaric acid resistance protein-like
MTVQKEFRSFFALRPTPGRLLIAAEAAISIGLPPTVFTVIGQPQLGLLALPGAFSVMFLAGRARPQRIALFPLIALGFVATSAIGVGASQNLAASLIALFLVAGTSATLCFGFGVGPPGALLFVLVTGASNHLAAPLASQGAAIRGSLVVRMVAVGCLLAYVVVLSPLLVPAVRRCAGGNRSDRKPAAFRLDPISRLIVFRLIIASAIAVVVSAPLGVHRVYWVLMTAVAILQNGHHFRLTARRGIHRVGGTLVGVALFAVIAAWSPKGLWLAALLAVLTFVAELVILRNYGLGLVLITPLALTIAAQGHSEPHSSIAGDRVVDTLLGGGVALLVLMLSIALQRFRPLKGIPR